MTNRLFTYISQSRTELTKVSWPNRQQAWRLTLVVIGFSIILSTLIGGLDYGFSQLCKK